MNGNVEKSLERIMRAANSVARALIQSYENITISSVKYPPESEEREKSQEFLSAIRDALPMLRNLTFKLELLYLMHKQGNIDESRILAAVPTESEIESISRKLIILDDPLFAEMAKYMGKPISQYFHFNVGLKLVDILFDLHPKAFKIYNGDEKPKAASDIWVKLWQVQFSLIDLLEHLQYITPETKEDTELVGFAERALRNLIDDCGRIRDAIDEEFNEDAIVAAFPVREHLASIENALARLDEKYRYVLPVSLRETFANWVFNPLVSVKNTLIELGVEGLEDKWLEAAPTAPPTKEELEEEYRATPLGLADDIRTSFEKVLGIFAQVYADGEFVSDFLQNLRGDFEAAMRSGDPLKLGDIHRQISNLYLGAKLEKESEEAKQIEDFLTKLSKYIEELRRWTKRLLKFKILSEVLGGAAAKENAAS